MTPSQFLGITCSVENMAAPATQMFSLSLCGTEWNGKGALIIAETINASAVEISEICPNQRDRNHRVPGAHSLTKLYFTGIVGQIFFGNYTNGLEWKRCTDHRRNHKCLRCRDKQNLPQPARSQSLRATSSLTH